MIVTSSLYPSFALGYILYDGFHNRSRVDQTDLLTSENATEIYRGDLGEDIVIKTIAGQEVCFTLSAPNNLPEAFEINPDSGIDNHPFLSIRYWLHIYQIRCLSFTLLSFL